MKRPIILFSRLVQLVSMIATIVAIIYFVVVLNTTTNLEIIENQCKQFIFAIGVLFCTFVVAKVINHVGRQ